MMGTPAPCASAIARRGMPARRTRETHAGVAILEYRVKSGLSAVISFLVLVASAVCLASEGPAPIRLKATTIDTGRLRTDQRPHRPPPPATRRYFIIQSKEAMCGALADDIVARGAKIISYLPENAFLVEGTPAQIAAVRRLDLVHWSGRYQPEYKVSPRLKAQLRSGKHPQWLTILVFESADLRELLPVLAREGVQLEGYSAGATYQYLKVKFQPRLRIDRVASLESVAWIEATRPLQLIDAPPPTTGDVPADIMNLEEVWAEGLDGAGQIVGICDTGLDVGINGPPLHDDLEGRLTTVFALGRPGDWSDDHGHGTHVAGTAVGDGSISGGLFRGGAFGAQLVMQSAYVSEDDPLGGIPTNLYTLFNQAYGEGARIHSNSWGSPDHGHYSVYSQQTDEFMWDHKDMLLVFAAGNDGVDADNDGVIDQDSLYSPASAKNCLAVGASENVRSSGGLSDFTWGLLGFLDGNYQAEPLYSDYISDNEDGLAAFSSRGPCDDGRIKPDMVAPGTDIISCRTQDPVGYALVDFNTWGAYDGYYVYMGGTSMAAPAAAGSAALARQFLIERAGISNPSAALMKATLINGAYDMVPGQYGSGATQEINARPNNAEGWGRVDLYSSLFSSTQTEISFVDAQPGLSTSESTDYEIVVGDPGVPFRATLTYTDYPGNPAASVQLVNDLDLIVIDGSGVSHYPNRLTGPDRINNVETIDIPAPEAGIYQVRVSAHNTPFGPQPYGLVVSRGKKSGVGQIVLNKEAYGQADTTATVTVIDTDIAGAGSQAVTLTSTTDATGESVTLNETSPGTGVFVGQVGLTTSSPGSGEIQVADGDVITALYPDADHGGPPQDVTDTATVDLVLPTISNVAVALVETDRAVIGWSTSEACDGLVSFGPSPSLGDEAVSGAFTTSRTVELTSLQPTTRYYFSVASADPAGNTATDDNGGALYTFATGYGSVTFADDMEQGPSGWTHSGDFDQWEHGVPTYIAGPAAAHSPDNCWGTDLDSYFMHDDFISGWWIEESLESPPIDVGQAATLTFWHWYDLVEANDEMTVEVSADGGPWQNVTPGAYYEGTSYGWTKETIDLAAFANTTIRVQFHIWADTWFDFLDPRAGWYVDDVEVSTFHAFGYGSVTMDRRTYSLATPVVVTVIDGHENTDPALAETVAVTVASDLEPAGETLVLTETDVNTGTFAGAIMLSTTVLPGDDLVGVAAGNQITATYTDLDDGAGNYNRQRTATAQADLTGPALSGLTVSGISTNGALIEFSSDPNATATVSYGTGGVYDHEVSATSPDGSFSFTLTGLQDNLLYSFIITLEDEAGNVVPYNSPPQDFQFGTRATRTYAANQFDGETSPLHFSSDNVVWELGTPEFGPPTAFSVPDCWGTNLDGTYPINCDVSITSDWITLRPDSQFALWHWYSINEYLLEDAYGVVEVTTNGADWQDVTPLPGVYVGTGEDWIPETIDLSSYGAVDVRLRLRLYSQEAEIVLYYYAGWYVDDVSLVQTINYGKGSLFFDREIYSLSTPVEIMLIDAHLNTNPAVAESVLLTVSSSQEGLDVLLTETAPNSGKFVALVTLDDAAPTPDGLLQVAATDIISVQYNDADDGSGSPALATAQADVDLVLPLISALSFSDVSDTSFQANWTTDEPCVGRVSYGKTTDTAVVIWSVGYVTAHSIEVTGLDENAGYFVKVSSTDQAGNEATDDNGGSWYRVYTDVRKELFRDDFDRDEKGWTHLGVGDEWEKGTPSYGIGAAASPPNCWATDLDATYPGTVDASLMSPSIDLEADARLSFKHWYNIEEFDLDDGMGFVEVSTNGTDWTNISRDGGYTGKAKAGWHEEVLSLASAGAATANVRFRLSANQTIEYYYPGWHIDDLSVYVLKPYGYGVLLLDRQLYTLADQIKITLKDAHLNLDPELAETAQVSISSTTEPTPQAVTLVETDPTSGVFEALVPISQFPGVGSLQVSNGDTVSAQYTDADDAEGGSNVLLTAQAQVSILDSDGDGMPDAWETQHGLDPGSSVGDDGADGDPDGDGMRNHDEMVADTDPRDAASLLAVVQVSETVEGIVVRWQSRPYKLYRIHSSPDLAGWSLEDTVPSMGDETEWLDTSTSSTAKKFYKIEVVQ